jgi:hypothetical protein
MSQKKVESRTKNRLKEIITGNFSDLPKVLNIQIREGKKTQKQDKIFKFTPKYTVIKFSSTKGKQMKK